MVQSPHDDRARARSEREPIRALARVPIPETSAVVLCGGLSSRMGVDKARLELDGLSLIARAVRVVQSITPHVRLACGSHPRYEDLGLPLVLDRIAGAGPLAGLEAALASAPEGFVIAVACDMPRIDAGALRALVTAAHERELDVALMRSPRGLEPLCAVWRTSMVHPLRAALERGERRVVAAFEIPLATGALPRVAAVELDAAIAREDCVLNVNTPAEFERARSSSLCTPGPESA